MDNSNKKLTEKQLLPILQFTESLIRINADYRRNFDIDIVYSSDEKTVTYKFDIALELGRYKAELVVSYQEDEDNVNDWDDLKAQLYHIQQIITT